MPRTPTNTKALPASIVMRGGGQAGGAAPAASANIACSAARNIAEVAFREAMHIGMSAEMARDVADNVFSGCRDVGQGHMDEPLAEARALFESYAGHGNVELSVSRLKDSMAQMSLDCSTDDSSDGALPAVCSKFTATLISPLRRERSRCLLLGLGDADWFFFFFSAYTSQLFFFFLPKRPHISVASCVIYHVTMTTVMPWGTEVQSDAQCLLCVMLCLFVTVGPRHMDNSLIEVHTSCYCVPHYMLQLCLQCAWTSQLHFV